MSVEPLKPHKRKAMVMNVVDWLIDKHGQFAASLTFAEIAQFCPIKTSRHQTGHVLGGRAGLRMYVRQKLNQ